MVSEDSSIAIPCASIDIFSSLLGSNIAFRSLYLFIISTCKHTETLTGNTYRPTTLDSIIIFILFYLLYLHICVNIYMQFFQNHLQIVEMKIFYPKLFHHTCPRNKYIPLQTTTSWSHL